METTSSSAVQNENLLTEMINYINERHSNLFALSTDQNKGRISNEIETIESKISFYKSQNLLDLSIIESEISFLKEITRVNLEASISKLKSDLLFIDQEISQLNQVIIDDSNNLNIVKSSTFAIERAASSPTLEQIISSYKSQINQLRRERNNSISDLSILSQKLDALNKDILQSDGLFVLGNRQKIYENQLKMLMNETQVKTQPIGNIGTNTIKPKTQLIITLGIIIGFITSIFLVFINNFIKSYKESEA